METNLYSRTINKKTFWKTKTSFVDSILKETNGKQSPYKAFNIYHHLNVNRCSLTSSFQICWWIFTLHFWFYFFFFSLISFSFSFSFFLFIVISFLFVQILEPAEVFILNAKTLVSIKQDFLNSNNSAPNWIRNLILCVCNLFSLLIKKQKSQILCM